MFSPSLLFTQSICNFSYSPSYLTTHPQVYVGAPMTLEPVGQFQTTLLKVANAFLYDLLC